MTEEIDWSGYEQVKIGVKTASKVASIRRGTLDELRVEAYWAASDMSKSDIAEKKKCPGIEVVTENGAHFVLTLPSSRQVHPKSNLAAWLRTYGDFPRIGQQVNTETDKNGFQRIVLNGSA